jgi:hypothetical protein
MAETRDRSIKYTLLSSTSDNAIIDGVYSSPQNDPNYFLQDRSDYDYGNNTSFLQ